ncbi:MAG: cation diffusion facilitator family transporter [Candidatus Melainabacteria bacterium]|nr:cation diffusion facilitator family transporter [Candidatus Melainabacteria bacterium]
MDSGDASGGSSSLLLGAGNGASVVPGPSSGNGYLYHHALRAVIAAMALNFMVAGLKLAVAMFITRSTSLFSEGLHSAADGLNSLCLLFGIMQGKRSPDRTHPFGYGLETNLWALLASFVLFVSAGYSIWIGWERIMNPTHFGEDIFWAVAILAVSAGLEVIAILTASRAVLEEVGIKAEGWAVIPQAFANVHKVVGPTTRFVFYEDTLALIGALIALFAIGFSQLAHGAGWLSPDQAHWPDAIGSILIGFLLLGLAISLFRYNRLFLTGSAASAQTETTIRSLVESIHEVSEIHDLKTIDQGLGGLFVHMSVEVDPETQVKDVDDVTDRIKERLQERMPNVKQVFIEVLADETEEEWGERFNQLIEHGQEQGVLKPREVIILRNVYDFTESVVSDIMIPRPDTTLVEKDTPLSEVADLIIETCYSRIPVYEKRVDQVVGVVHARDVFDRIRKGDMETPLADVLRELDLYPENKPVSDLLEDFKRKKIQMAAVIDEHGGFAGLVTIEDLLEEIVGDIWDEHDEEDILLQLEAPNQLLVNGKIDIEDLNDRFDLNIPDDEFKTLGGFVFGLLGREPELNDSAMFEDLTLSVVETDGPRIAQVRIVSPVPFGQRVTEDLSRPSEPLSPVNGNPAASHGDNGGGTEPPGKD